MRFTQFTDFALRLLVFVAAHPDRRTTIAEVAAAYGISRSHLMKVASKLSQADILRPPPRKRRWTCPGAVCR